MATKKHKRHKRNRREAEVQRFADDSDFTELKGFFNRREREAGARMACYFRPAFAAACLSMNQSQRAAAE